MNQIFSADGAACANPAVILDSNSELERAFRSTGEPCIPGNFDLVAERNMGRDSARYLTRVVELDPSPLAGEGIGRGQPPGIKSGKQVGQISLAFLQAFVVSTLRCGDGFCLQTYSLPKTMCADPLL